MSVRIHSRHPRQATAKVEPEGKLDGTSTWTYGTNALTAKLKYQRGNGAETAIPWSGASHTLEFVDGWLNAGICLNEGPDPTPAMTLSSGTVIISSVWHGDKIIVEETDTGNRDEIAVVKNFSWNDLQRLGPSNLKMHPDYNALRSEIKNAIIETILFCLDTSPTRQQKAQFDGNMFYDSGIWDTPPYTNFRQNHPNLLQLDIPSARSIGSCPFDLDHFHLALETYPLPPTIAEKMDALAVLQKNIETQPFLDQQAQTRQPLVDLMNLAYESPDKPFLLFHSYDLITSGSEGTYFPAYLTPSATDHLLWGDPVRHIRWNLWDTQHQHPWLTYPKHDTHPEWEGKESSPQGIWFVSFFVDRKGQVVLFPRSLMWNQKGMASDALREE